MTGSSVFATLRRVRGVSSSEAPSLDEAPFENDQIELAEEPVDLIELVRGAGRHFAREAESKGLSMEFSIAPGVPKIIYADPRRLRQMLLILLGNSVRFTYKGGVHVAVRVSAENDGRALELMVSDTGAGADASASHGIFTRLVRAMSGASTVCVDHEKGSSLCFRRRFDSPEGAGEFASPCSWGGSR